MQTLKKNLCYIENDDAINCTMQIPNTYWKFMFTQFNKVFLPKNHQIFFGNVEKIYFKDSFKTYE
jgi:hypothetical protein